MGLLPPSSILATLPTFSTSSTPAAMGALSALPLLSTIISPEEMTLPLITGDRDSQSLPPKLVTKILQLEYVEMSELIPASWRFNDSDQKCCHLSRRPNRRGPITDILLWVECYSSLVSVLATKFPGKIPNLMAYQKTIVKAQQTFIGEGWVTYDACFRRRASYNKSLEWGVVDFTLYNETFTGRAKAIARCRHCLSEHHTSNVCVYAPDTQAGSGETSSGRYTTRAPRATSRICQLFNSKMGNKCRYNPCKYDHSCSECNGSHPHSNCHRNPPAKRARAESPYLPKK